MILLFSRLILTSMLAILLAGACSSQSESAEANGNEALVNEALSAAPPAIAAIASVKNWNGETLKEGSDEWVCYPSMPDREGVCPMCLDKPWQAWLAAFAEGETPPSGVLGVSYMLRGDCAVSNLDPMAMEKTEDNEWVHEGPHIMLLAADPETLNEYPHDHESGAPYVMWRDTPYAHIMVPLGSSEE